MGLSSPVGCCVALLLRSKRKKKKNKCFSESVVTWRRTTRTEETLGRACFYRLSDIENVCRDGQRDDNVTARDEPMWYQPGPTQQISGEQIASGWTCEGIQAFQESRRWKTRSLGHMKRIQWVFLSNEGTPKCNPLFGKLSQLLKYHTVQWLRFWSKFVVVESTFILFFLLFF